MRVLLRWGLISSMLRVQLLCALFCFVASAFHTLVASADSCLVLQLCRMLAIFLSFTAAVLSKETGVAILGILAGQEMVASPPTVRHRTLLLGRTSRLLLLLICALAYTALRSLLMASSHDFPSLRQTTLADSELIRRAENPLAFVTDWTEWVLSVLYVQVTPNAHDCDPSHGSTSNTQQPHPPQVVYFGLVAFPTSFCIEYSYDCIPMVTSIRDPRNLYSLALLLGAAVITCMLIKSAFHRSPNSLAVFAWLFFPWLLISHIPLRLGTLVAERTLYLPSVGALLLLAHSIRVVLHRVPIVRARRQHDTEQRLQKAWRIGMACPVALISAYLAALSLQRNLDWRSDESAFEAALQVCPRSAKVCRHPR